MQAERAASRRRAEFFDLRFGPASAALAAIFAIACSDGSSSPADDSAPVDVAARRGRQIYGNVCIACHNADPAQAGSLGPPLAGASQALLEAKLLRGEYPPGYTPSRPGQSMPRFEHLRDHIPELAAYLQQKH
jgi:mono/diheme cytochrome c family protein